MCSSDLAVSKAVKQLGLSPRTMLPTNEAIEEALARLLQPFPLGFRPHL